MKLTWNVNDAGAVQEKLLSSKQVVTIPVDFTEFTRTDSPPPKGAFQLLDRPLPADDAELTVDILPHKFCQMLLFGKETDRDARLELFLAKGEQFELGLKMVSEMVGDLVAGDPPSEEILDSPPIDLIELFPAVHFSNETTPSVERRRLSDQAVSVAFWRSGRRCRSPYWMTKRRKRVRMIRRIGCVWPPRWWCSIRLSKSSRGQLTPTSCVRNWGLQCQRRSIRQDMTSQHSNRKTGSGLRQRS